MHHNTRDDRERGQGILEFAVIFPFFVLLVAIVIDVGLLFQRHATIQHAVREGARYGALRDNSDDGDFVRARTSDQAISLIDPEDVEVCFDDIDGGGVAAGDAIDVSVSYTYSPLMLSSIGGLFGANLGDFDFTVTGSARLEGDLAQAGASC
jgi:Flp pilus assembly protein TadG